MKKDNHQKSSYDPVPLVGAIFIIMAFIISFFVGYAVM